MTYSEACNAILGMVKTAWDPTGFPMQWPGKFGKPPTTETVWARCSIQHATGRQTSLADSTGKRRWKNTGTIFVQVFYPIGDGTDSGYNAAQIIINAFRDFRNDDLWLRDPRINEAGDDGAFKQINALATFTYDDMR